MKVIGFIYLFIIIVGILDMILFFPFAVHIHNDFLLAILTRCQIIVSTPGMIQNALHISLKRLWSKYFNGDFSFPLSFVLDVRVRET